MKAYTYEVFHRCESITDWTSAQCSLALSSTQKVEGKYSIKMTSDDNALGYMEYNKTTDWSEFEDIVFSVYHPGWTNETGTLTIASSPIDYKRWNFNFAAVWTERSIDLSSTPDDSNGTLDLSSITYVSIQEKSFEIPGEDYYFDFFRGRSIDVADYIENIRIRDGIFPIRKVGSFLTHPDHENYFTKKHTLEILDDSDNLIFLGTITDKNRGTDGLYRYVLSSYFNEAHSLNYAKAFSSDKSSEKIQDIIDNSLAFITRSTSITATALDYDYSLNRPSAALINLIRFLEREVISIGAGGLMTTEAYDGLTKAIQYYGATYNFRDDIIGGNPAGWTIDEGGGTVNIISDLDGHKKVVELNDIDAGDTVIMNRTITQVANQTIELWFAVNDITTTNGFAIQLIEGATRLILIQVDNDDLDYYDGANKSIKDDFITVNTIIHLKIICDDSNNQFDCYINGILEGNNLSYENNSTIGVNQLRFNTGTGDILKVYIDAIGLSSDPNYNVGDNVVAWDVSSLHQIVMLIEARDFKSGYFKGSLGITRTSVRMDGNVIRTKPDDRADTEQAIGVIPLKEYRDLKLVANAEADQLATNLFNIFSLETEFIALRIEGEGFLPPGQTLNIRNTGSILITQGDFCIISFTYDPKSDVYLEMIVSNNVVLPSEFMSNFDTSMLQIHQANLQTFENAAAIRFTEEGGVFVKLTNETGVPSVKGSLVKADTVVDNAFILTAGNDNECFGVVYEDGIVDGAECKIVFSGRAQVLLKDATASTAGNWVMTSDVAGRADATGATPAAAPAHFKEIGHAIEAKGADTDVLAFTMLHFN